MNKTTEALKLAEEAQTPLKDLLRAVPKDGSDLYEEDKFCHHNIPYGRLIHEALAEIERLEVLAKPEITTPDVCGEVCARAKLCYGCGKALDEANAKLANHSGDGNEMVAEPAIPEWVDVDDYEEPVKQEPVAFEQCEELSADKARWYRMADMIEQQAQELKGVLRQALNLIEGEWPEGDEVAQPVVDKIKKIVGERHDI